MISLLFLHLENENYSKCPPPQSPSKGGRQIAQRNTIFCSKFGFVSPFGGGLRGRTKITLLLSKNEAFIFNFVNKTNFSLINLAFF